MVQPKCVLVCRAFAGFSSPIRFFSQEIEMPVTKAYIPCRYILCVDLTTRVSGKFAAVGSLKVAKFDDGYRGVGIAFEMAHLADQEVHHFFSVLRRFFWQAD